VPAGGSVAALAVAMSAGLVAMAARVSSDPGGVAQADSIRARVTPLAAEDARVYREAMAAMRSPAGESAEERDEAIRQALVRAAEVPLEIAEAGPAPAGGPPAGGGRGAQARGGG
jgi:formiminotetrahydrofolate cyclodeaminase